MVTERVPTSSLLDHIRGSVLPVVNDSAVRAPLRRDRGSRISQRPQDVHLMLRLTQEATTDVRGVIERWPHRHVEASVEHPEAEENTVSFSEWSSRPPAHLASEMEANTQHTFLKLTQLLTSPKEISWSGWTHSNRKRPRTTDLLPTYGPRQQGGAYNRGTGKMSRTLVKNSAAFLLCP